MGCIQENPGLKKWADKKNLQAVAHAYAEAGSLSELDKKIADAEKIAGDIDDEILKCEKTLTELKELSVFVQNYQKYRKFDEHYRAAKDPEDYYESHESQLMIFGAAERHIREKGLDPEQVSYKQVMDGIQRMQEKAGSLKEKYKVIRADIRDMEKQRDMIREYLEKDKQNDRLAPSRKSIPREIL